MVDSKGQKGRGKEGDRMELALVRGALCTEDLASWPDEDLVGIVSQGHEGAFEILVSRYKSRILNFVYRIVRDADAAEDLAQETFLRVYRNAGRYKRIAKFSTWIYTIAANLAKNELRNRSRRHGVTWDEVQNLQIEKAAEASISLRAHKPDRRVERKELRAALNQAIDRRHKSLEELLNRMARRGTVFVVRDVEGFAYEEIARMLKLPKGTVKSRINRARLRFKDYFEENFQELLDG